MTRSSPYSSADRSHAHAHAHAHARVRAGRVLIPIILVVLFAGLLAAGVMPRVKQGKDRAEESAAAMATPIVYTETVTKDTSAVRLELPGTVGGLHETGIYARTNGFVKALRVDLGSMVRKGDTLIVLDLPDIAEQLRQARATQEQVEATATLAHATLSRWRSMLDKAAVTPQEFDEKQAAANVADANLRAAKANVATLSEQQRFGALVAPFSGIISARSVDLGALVSSGAVTGNRALLTLTQIDTLRVMINVPQNLAPQVRVGEKADVVVRDLGDAKFEGHVALTARAIDPTSRTLLTEIHVNNADRRLLPGMFSQVSIVVPATGAGIRIPAIALIIRADGPQVAKVDNGVVHLAKIKLGRDFGTSLEVLSGIEPGAHVIVNPSEQLSEGAAVKTVDRSRPVKK
jgi:RND family efflux transporter MFP subunit